MTFSPDQLFEEDGPQWFCLQSLPKQEHLAAAALRIRMGVETLSPRIKFRRATRRGAVWFLEAMFPGYLFARCIYRESFRGVQSIPGVRGFVRFGDRVAILDEAIVDGLKTLTAKEETIVFDPDLQEGDRVKITEGAFHGLEAVITSLLPSRERVKVLLNFLGREVEAEVTAPRLVSVDSPRGAHLGVR